MRTKPWPPASPAWARWAARDRVCAQLLHGAAAWPPTVRLLVLVSRLGDGPLWYGTIALLPWIGGPQGLHCAVRLFGMGVVNLVIYKILKQWFARPRPYQACPEIRACTRSLDEHSFPSGHTLHAVAFGTLLAAYYPPLDWVLWPFVALVALSRVVLGLHYPSDVLAAALLGLASAHVALSYF